MDGIDDVVRLTRSQRQQAIDLLTRAFVDDPGYSYVFPDRAERDQALRRFWNALLIHCGVYGEVYTTSTLGGISCWLSPGRTSPSFWQLLRTGFALPKAVLSYPAEARARLEPLMRHNDEVHKRTVSRPHWYLGALAVDPDRQRRGIGSALLQPVLARADESRTPCYLETQSRANAAFYERQGFLIVNEEEVEGTGLTMWGMLREPQPPTRRPN